MEPHLYQGQYSHRSKSEQQEPVLKSWELTYPRQMMLVLEGL
jgi:hypothetical protein